MENNNVNKDSMLSDFMLNAKREIIQYKRSLLLVVGCILGSYILIGILMGYNHCGGGKTEFVTYSVIMLMFGAVCSSMAFSNLKTKEERIFSLMMPASEFSKFFLRWLAVVPILFGLLVVAFYVGDIFRILTFIVFTPDYSDYPNYLQIMNPQNILLLRGREEGDIVLSLVLATYFFTQAWYLLGAVIWPKLSFIKTFVALWVLQMGVGILCTIIGGIFHLRIQMFISSVNDIWWISGGMIATSLVLYALTYWRYKRTQVVYKLF